MTFHPHHAMRHGFSLVELLVVIAVIAVIAGMLLPALGIVRSAARSMRCQSNLRQMYIASSVYSEDNLGLVVRVNVNDAYFWFEHLTPYLDAQAKGSERGDGSVSYNDVSRRSVIWDCPAFERRESAATWNPPYGMNAWLLEPMRDAATGWRFTNGRWSPNNGWTGAFREFDLGAITQRGKRALFGDSHAWCLMPDASAQRHRGQANFVFVDGHTAPIAANVQNLARDNPAALP